MPRAFTEIEKGAIRSKLLETGRDCFLRFGLKKTTIEDLTRPAGIAKASFYLFFESKEQLFVEVFLEEVPAMIDRMLAASFEKTSDTREALILFMQEMMREIDSNAFARILMDDQNEIERLVSNLDFDEVLRRSTASFAPVVQAISEAQARGDIVEGDPFHLTYALGLVKILAFNRSSLPDELYRAMLDLAPTIIAEGLTCPAKRHTPQRVSPGIPNRGSEKKDREEAV